MSCTGKERDSESGLDYFGARYYGSPLGRFTSPDWSASPEAIPYSKLENPQSLNLYAYVGNNPLTNRDSDGHCPDLCITEGIAIAVGSGAISGTTIAAGLGLIMSSAAAALDLGHAPSGYVPGGLTDANGNSVFATKADQQSQPLPTRGQALNDAKNDAGVPTSQQPQKQETVPLTDSSGKPIVVDGQKQNTREYTHTTGSGDTVVIQDHSQGHTFPDGGQVGPHINVRPADDTRNGTVPGTQPHYPYKKPGDQQ